MKTKQRLSLFVTALVQVFFVSMNVVFITKGFIFLMLLTGFAISLLWTLNVKRIVIGNWTDRIVYASGASIGTLVGYFLSKFLILYLT